MGLLCQGVAEAGGIGRGRGQCARQDEDEDPQPLTGRLAPHRWVREPAVEQQGRPDQHHRGDDDRNRPNRQGFDAAGTHRSHGDGRNEPDGADERRSHEEGPDNACDGDKEDDERVDLRQECRLPLGVLVRGRIRIAVRGDVNDLVSHLDDLGVVGRDDDGNPGVRRGADGRQDTGTAVVVEADGRLVEEQQVGFLSECRRDGEAPLLPARTGHRVGVEDRLEPEGPDEVAQISVLRNHRRGEELVSSCAGDEVVLRVLRHPGGVPGLGEGELAGGRVVKPGQQPQQGGLADPAGP